MTEGDFYRPVRLTPELMATWATRTLDGRRVGVDWGEPDVDGFYNPTFRIEDDGMVVVDRRHLEYCERALDVIGDMPVGLEDVLGEYPA